MFMTLITNGRELVRKPRLSKLLSKKVLLSMAALGTAGAMAGLGTFANFTSTTSASHSDSTGTVVITLGATASGANRFSESSSTLVPGDTVERAIDLISSSTTGDLGGIKLTTTAPSVSSALDTDGTNGLQMELEKCSLPGGWIEAGGANARTYTCPLGTITSVLPGSPPLAVIGANRVLSGLSTLTGPSTDHLRLKLTLPSTAGNNFTSLTSTILYTFDATQRTGTSGR